ncbi:MAG: bifunctional glutamate N-acetyltransferase/amino-acid acetyltransferase ArgJ [Pseudomonadota bacterium]
MATITNTSPLAPSGGFPDLPQIAGVRFATCAAGVKYAGRTDVMLAEICAGATVAGVFTRSSTRAAPVLDCQEKLGIVSDPEKGFAILVNSGNANAFTGKAGTESVSAITQAVGRVLDIPPTHVYTSSTGVIGEPLPHDRITQALDHLADDLDATALEPAARAIMTTDTFPKGSTQTVMIGGAPVTISGFAKGSGMIAPDMATMLVYIFTDATLDQTELQALVTRLNETSFNAITVDSDTSTSDSLIAVATGASGVNVAGSAEFATALNTVMRDLAHQVVRDGEGASKFVEITVTGAKSDADAKTVAMACANSPLVKTAIAGEDANWGRIVMAVGKSGAQADRDLLSISFGDILVADKGWRAPDYSEEAASAYMKNQDIKITVDLGLGDRRFTAWTCDLTHGYISINADYRS